METPFVIYKASAGAGKTYTLVKEYLTMVFAGGEELLLPGFRSVLAITFTNKAAAEMKERIMQELDEMAAAPVDPEGDGMGPDILRSLRRMGGLWKEADGERLSRMADELRSLILHHYSDLSVSTIDSFMHRIVRTFAHDLGQPMNFEVMIDQQEMIEQAVAQLMSMAGTEGQDELTEVLRAFAESEMEDNRNYNIERQMGDLAALLFREDVGDHLRRLERLSPTDFQAIHSRYTGLLHAAEASMAKVGSEMLETLHGAGLTEETAPYGMSGYYGYVCRLADGKAPAATTRTVAAFEEGRLTGAKAPTALQAAAEAALPRLQSLYGQVQPLTVRCNTCRAVLKNLYSVALLGLLDSQMRGYAHDNEVVHLSDFNRLINKVVEDENNPAPFLFERLGNRYRHFLIDEFQDTSVMQWHNLVPLIENGVSQGHRSLVVGDGKQSIYRFRQGDVEQFIRLPRVEGMRHHGRLLPIQGNYSVENLAANHRSGKAIVDFNNRFFSYLAREVYADNPKVGEIYLGRGADGELAAEGNEELRQLAAKRYEGYVKVEYVTEAKAQEAGFEKVREAVYDRVLQTIEMLVHERGYAYRDIVVLTRSNAELGQVSSFLARHSTVPQTSTESFYLCESHAVMAIISTLRLLHNRTDRVAMADLLYRLEALGMNPSGGWEAGLDGFLCDGLPTGVPPLPVNLDYLASFDLYGCCEEIVRQLRLDGIDTPYVASLLNRVAAFSAMHRQGVGDFLEWFDAQKNLSAAASEELDAVQLLTIHKSKGLGKPVVICPLSYGSAHASELWVDVDGDVVEGASADGSTPSLPTAYVSLSADVPTSFEPQRKREQEMSEVDDLNILYVAFTRPKEQLYVFCPDPSDIKKRRSRDLRYPSLLYSFAPEGVSEGDPDFHSVGSGTTRKKAVVGVDRLSFSDWTTKVRIASPAEKAATALLERKIRFGIYAHDLLAGVACAADVDAAVARFAATQTVDDEEMQELTALAHRVVTHPDTARFFDPALRVSNECELVTDGKRLRPDRVVFAPDATWVVDFKTGVPLAEHSEQVGEYCQALRAMGHPSVSGYIIYLLPDISVAAC